MTTPILCPDEDRLLGMVDCELDQPQQEQVIEHVNECVTCQSRLETLVTHGLREDLEFDHVATHLRDGLTEIDSEISTDAIGQMTETLLSGNAHTDPIISLDFLQPSDAPDCLGRLGQYDVTEVIGRGGMGMVLKARDTRLDRIVAVKVLAPELASNPAACRRFLREAKAAAAISHDHVVTVHAVEPGDLPYLAMEYIDGCSLRQKIDREGPLPLHEILRISMQTARGLAAAHDQGLIHHDIKPANIMLQNGIERVQITDFGLARAVDDVTITRTGEVRGTPQFMSPEQAQGESTDPRSDLFNLGATMYTMCTGRAPFRGDSTMGVLHRVCNHAPREIREINPEIPEWLVSIIKRLLQKNREDRFQKAEEVADLLEQCLAHVQQPTVAPLPQLSGLATKTQPTRRKWYAGPIVALLLLGGLGMSEATGVTQLAGTVLRITLGEGTLVIEVDDPNVEIELDGEQLSISGAGIEELKLRPGQYQFRAIKDGEPVKQELVSIAHGGRQVVRVTREPRASTPRISGAGLPAQKDAFVVLGSKGAEVAEFDTLGDAVLGSSPGDTIEIRGNGPFVTDPIDIRHPLAIRAASGFRPVIVGNPTHDFKDRQAILLSLSSLVLEGLDIEDQVGLRCIVFTSGTLRMANCRILNRLSADCACVHSMSSAILKNCALIHSRRGTTGGGVSDEKFVVDNCVITGTGFCWSIKQAEVGSIQVRKSTLVSTGIPLRFNMTKQVSAVQDSRIQVIVENNVIDAPNGVLCISQGDRVEQIYKGDEAETFLLNAIRWREDSNLYFTEEFLKIKGRNDTILAKKGFDIAKWNRFWGQKNTGSVQASIRFQGGDLRTKYQASPEHLSPEDFRLRPDGAGYQAGPNGEDLGANVDFVGPGDGYERWQKTPNYQQWRNETRELIDASVAQHQ